MSLKNVKNKVSGLSKINEKVSKQKKEKHVPFNCNAESKSESGKGKKKIALSKFLPLPPELVSKKKTKKEVGSTKKSPCKNLSNHLALHSDTFNSSSPCDDRLSDASSYVAISEAESCPSERVSPHNDDNLQNFIPSSNHNHISSTVLPQSKTEFSTPPKEKDLNTKEIENVRLYGSACSPIYTLSHMELVCDSNNPFPLIESTRADTVLESSNASSSVTIFDQIKPNNSELAVTEDYIMTNCSELSNNCLSPKKSFLFLINKLNLTRDSKEDFVCNQLKCEPLIKPDGFDYDENNAFSIAVDVTMLKAASDYIKENVTRPESFSVTLPNNMKNYWQDNLVKSSDFLQLQENCLELNESDCNRFYSEDNESEISISSYKTADIQPEFFESTNLDSFSLEKCDIFPLDGSMNVAANEVCCTSSDVLAGIEEHSIKTVNSFSNMANENDNLNDIIEEESIPTSAKVKRRRNRNNIWATRKRRRCKKKKPIVENICCDTCDESEIDEPIPDSISPSKCLSNVDRSNALLMTKYDEDDNMEIIEVNNKQERKQSNKKSSREQCQKNEVDKPISPKTLFNTCDEGDNNEDDSVPTTTKVKRRKRKMGWTSKRRNCKKKEQEINEAGDIYCDTCDENEIDDPISDSISSKCLSNVDRSKDLQVTNHDVDDNMEDIEVSNSQESKQSNQKSRKQCQKNELDKSVSPETLCNTCDEGDNNEDDSIPTSTKVRRRENKNMGHTSKKRTSEEKEIDEPISDSISFKCSSNVDRSNDLQVTKYDKMEDIEVTDSQESKQSNKKSSRKQCEKNELDKPVSPETLCNTCDEGDNNEDDSIPTSTKVRKRKKKNMGHTSKKRTYDEKEIDEPISDSFSSRCSSNVDKTNDLRVTKYDEEDKMKDIEVTDSQESKQSNKKSSRKQCKKKEVNTLDVFCDTCDENDNTENVSMSNSQESKQSKKKSTSRKLKKNEVNNPISCEILCNTFDKDDSTKDLNVNNSQETVNITVESNIDKSVCSNNLIVKSSKNYKPSGKNFKLLQANCQAPIVEDKNFKSSVPIKRKRNQVKSPSEISIDTTLQSSTSGNSIDLKLDDEFVNTKPKKRKVDKNKNSKDNIKCSIPLKIFSTDSNIDNQHFDNGSVYNTETKPKGNNKGMKNNSLKENSKSSPVSLRNVEVPTSEKDVIEDKLSDNGSKGTFNQTLAKPKHKYKGINIDSYKKDPKNSSISLGNDAKDDAFDEEFINNEVKTLVVTLERLSKFHIDKLNEENPRKCNFSCKEVINNMDGIGSGIEENSGQHELKSGYPLTSPVENEIENKNYKSLSSQASLFNSKGTDKVSKAKKQNTIEKINVKSGENINEVTSIVIDAKNASEDSSPNASSSKSDSSKIKPCIFQRDKFSGISSKITKSSKKLKATVKKNKFSEKDECENLPVDKNSEMHLRKGVSILSQDESNTVKSKSLSPPKLLERENISALKDSENKNYAESVFQEEKEIPSNIDLPVSETSTEILENSSSIIASPSKSCVRKLKKSTVAFENENAEAVVIRIKNNTCSLVSETDQQLTKKSKTVPVKTKMNKKATKVKMLNTKQKEPSIVDKLSTENSNISPKNLLSSSTIPLGNVFSKSEENCILAENNLHLEESDDSEFVKNSFENTSLFKSFEDVALSEIIDTHEINNNNVLDIVNETQQTSILPLKQLENTEVSNYPQEVSNHEKKLVSKSSTNKPKNLKEKSSKEKKDKIHRKETFLSDVDKQNHSTEVDGSKHLKNVVDFGNSLNQTNTADDNIQVAESLTKLSSQNETEVRSGQGTESHDIVAQILSGMNDNYSLTDEDLDFEPDRLDESKSTNFVNYSADIDESSAQDLSNKNMDHPILTFHAEEDELFSDEESESDDEDNFKRSRYQRNISAEESHYSSKNKHETNFIQHEPNKLFSEVENTFHSDKPSKSSSTKILRFEDVGMKIKELCDQQQYHEAVEVARTYITISSTSDVNKSIFFKLLRTLFYSIRNSKKVYLYNSEILDNILQLMQSTQNNYCLCDKQTASYFIAKCCVHPDLHIYAVKLYDFCHIKHIPLNTKALSAFNSLLKTEDVSLEVLLHYFQYVKSVCFKKVSKDLTHSALEKSKKSRFSHVLVHSMCEFLYCINAKEVEGQDLKGFLQLCFQKGMWAYIAEMFIKWDAKGSLMSCIHESLLADFEKMGKYFYKFADAIHEQEGDLSPDLKQLFCQMGTTLMLAAVSKNLIRTALEILHALHVYNANYSEMQSSPMEPPSKVDDSINIFPYSVVFHAIDIFLNSKRPKDAFIIFQGFSWITPNENFNEEEKAHLLSEKCERLLKLIPLLNSEDSLNEGWEALKIFLSEAEQDSYREKLNENKKEACLIYNKYLVHLLNSGKISSVQDLYQYSLGPKKDVFVVSSKLLRGLVITFSSHGMTEEASAVFTVGVMRKVYSIEKPETGSFPWDIVVMSDWTTVEIKLAMEWFIKTLFPLLADKPTETNFEKWFSVQISFKVSGPIKSKILCLREIQSDSESCIQRTKNALQNMDPSLQFSEEPSKNTLCITSDSLYHYWKSKCSDVSLKFPSSDTNILPNDKRRISFGNEKSIPIGEPYFTSSLSEKSKKLENRPMKSPRDNRSTSAETSVSEYIDKIRTNQQAQYTRPSSPKCSPPKSYQKVLHNNKSSSSVLTVNNTSSSVCGMEVTAPSKQAFKAAAHTNTSNITNTKVSKSISLKQNDTFDDISCSPYIDFSNNQLTNSKLSNSKSPKKNDILNNKSIKPSANLSNNQPISSKLTVIPQKINEDSDVSNIQKNTGMQTHQNMKVAQNASDKPLTERVPSKPLMQTVGNTNLKFKKVLKNNFEKLRKQSLPTPKRTPMKLSIIKSLGSNSISKKKPLVLNKKTKKNIRKGTFENLTLTISLSSDTSVRTVSDTSKQNSMVANQNDTSNVEENVTPQFVVELPDSGVNIPAVPSVSSKKTNTAQSNSSGLSVNLSNSQISNQKQKTVIVSKKTSPTTTLPKHSADVPGKTSISALPKQLTDVVPKKTINLKIVKNNQVYAAQSGNTSVTKTALQTNSKSTPRTFNKLKINKNSTLNADPNFDREKSKLVGPTVVNSCSRIRNIQGNAKKGEPSSIEKPVVKRINIENKEATKAPSGSVCYQNIGNDFKKIIDYLKVKIAQKYKNLSSDEQDQKARKLALVFTNNDTNFVLGKIGLKQLYNFANCNV